MFKATINKPWWFSRFEVPPDIYFLDSITAAQAMSQHAVSEIEVVENPVLNHKDIQDGDSVCIARPGCFGDLLLLTPLIQQLRQDHPGVQVTVACHPRYSPILFGVVDVIDYPIVEELYNQFDHVVWTEGVLEDRYNILDKYPVRYGKCAGYDKLGVDSLQYIVTPEEAAWAEDEYPKEEGEVWLGIQVRASSINRTYDQVKLINVMANVLNEKIADHIFLIGAPDDVRYPEVQSITNLTSVPLSVRMSVAVAHRCDALIVPDSLFMHIGSALSIPTLVLSGAFDPAQTLAMGSPTVHTIRGMGNCRNCRYLPVAGEDFPPDKKCAETRNCVVIDGIAPEFVAMAVKNVLAGKPIY